MRPTRMITISKEILSESISIEKITKITKFIC